MTSNFKEIMNSESFLNAYGFNKKGICFVEDESDIPFWDYLISKNLSGKFDIKPASSTINPHARGKKALCEKIPYLNNKQIIAIDSDFDYILNTPNKEIFNNKYIIQTFFYSRESVIYRVERLDLIINQIKYNINHDFKLSSFLNIFSAKCYEVLINIFYLAEIGAIEYSIVKESINKILDLSYKKNIVDENIVIDNSFLNKIDANLLAQLKKYESLITPEKINNFKLEKESIGLNANNAYQYIDGHLLEDYVNCFFKATVDYLIKTESLRIVNESHGVVKENRRKHIKDQTEKMEKHFNNKCNYLTLIDNLLAEDFSSYCYNRIIEKIILVQS